MRDTKVFPYLYDFISIIFENPESRKYIRRIVLFGSVARGDFDRRSDIDIFIDAPENAIRKLEPAIKECEKRFQITVEKKWSILGIEMPIRYIIGDMETYRWKEIKSEIISTGMVLYGKYEAKKEDTKPYLLFIFSTKKLKQKDRMKFRRKLFGYKSKGGKYEQSGYLAEIGGLKLTSSILIPLEKAEDVRKFMSKFRITPEIREIWTK